MKHTRQTFCRTAAVLAAVVDTFVVDRTLRRRFNRLRRKRTLVVGAWLCTKRCSLLTVRFAWNAHHIPSPDENIQSSIPLIFAQKFWQSNMLAKLLAFPWHPWYSNASQAACSALNQYLVTGDASQNAPNANGWLHTVSEMRIIRMLTYQSYRVQLSLPAVGQHTVDVQKWLVGQSLLLEQAMLFKPLFSCKGTPCGQSAV